MIPEAEPRRPQGVLAIVDGLPVEPVDVEYAGRDAAGDHQWIAMFDIEPDSVDSVHIDLLPGFTSVNFAFPKPSGDTP